MKGEEEKLKEQVREYEKAAGIDSDGFINQVLKEYSGGEYV